MLGRCASQWHYFLQECAVSCVRQRHRHHWAHDASVGLAVNEGKAKYKLGSCLVCGVRSRITEIISMLSRSTAITTNNDGSLEIKRRVTLPSRCYFGLNKQLSMKRPLSYDEMNILQVSLSLWRSGMDAVKHRCCCTASVREKSAAQDFWSSKSWR